MAEKVSKWFSRKLIVWITWSGLTIFGVLRNEGLPIDTIIQFYGFISLLYIGGNVAQKYIDNRLLKDNTLVEK